MLESKMEKLAVINKYMDPAFAHVSSRIRNNKNHCHIFCDGNSMFMVSDANLRKVDTHKHDLVGVYDCKIDHEDLRDDLFWYAVNYLEDKQ